MDPFSREFCIHSKQLLPRWGTSRETEVFMIRGKVLMGSLIFSSALLAGSQKEVHMTLQLTSKNFQHQGEIPRLYTCDGKDVSPSLSWTGAPAGTKSFALIVDDPDAPDPKAPKMTWVHWVLYDIPAGVVSLAEGISSKNLSQGTLEGSNDWKRTGYGGPCPPIGRHRYFFKLYALDTVLPDLRQPTKAALEKAMSGHILEKAELVGTYQRN
jgi:Raf kinase inhibitor-like YbhB/YbcL family protein